MHTIRSGNVRQRRCLVVRWKQIGGRDILKYGGGVNCRLLIYSVWYVSLETLACKRAAEKRLGQLVSQSVSQLVIHQFLPDQPLFPLCFKVFEGKGPISANR